MKRMLIDDTQPEETRVVIVDGNKIEDVEFESTAKKQIKGNIFSAKIVRIEPSLQAAFVDYGGNRHGFLAFGEIHPDYYNLTDEQKAEVEAEVDEIIEKKRIYHQEKKAEQERRRLEREQRRAEYEARRLAELEREKALANAYYLVDDCCCGCDCACQRDYMNAPKVEVVEEVVEAKPETAVEVNDKVEDVVVEDTQDVVVSQEIVEEVKEAVEENALETVENVEVKAEEPVVEEPVVEEAVESKTTKDNAEATEEATSEESNEEAVSEEAQDKPRQRRRGNRFLGGRRGAKSKFKVSTEASGLNNDEEVSEEVDYDEDEDFDDVKNCDCADDNDDIENGADDDEDADFEEFLKIQRKLIYARKLHQKFSIQDVLREGQVLVIQVVKEERGNKGAACTTYLSLAGRYCVLMPNRVKSGGVSRKITSVADRKRLKEILHGLPISENMSLIIRTAGEDKPKEDIVRDYNYLIRSWNHIRYSALSNNAPCLIYEEGNLIKRALRDMYTKDIAEVIIDGDEAYKMAKDFSKILSPNMSRKVKCRKADELPVFQQYQVEKELDKLHNPVVQLESGGYLVINPTEALVSIDVNSGRATHEMDIEETALKTNLEAADEIAKQLRLRNLAGLVVVDFIDMEEQANNHAVEKRMKEAMKPDRARVQIAKMSIFGLLEISRQRLHSSLMESNFVTCPHCKGLGVQRTSESSAAFILRAIEEEGIKALYECVEFKLPTDIALYLLNNKRLLLAQLETKYEMKIVISADNSICNVADFKVERIRKSKPKTEQVALTTAYAKEQLDVANENDYNDDETDEVVVDEVQDDASDEVVEKDNRFRRHHDRRTKFGRRNRKERYNNAEKDAEPEVKHEEPALVVEKVEEPSQPKEKKTWWKKLIG